MQHDVFEFDNGVLLAVEEMSGVNSCAMTWLVPAGSAHDPKKMLGLASIRSEMLLRGAGLLDSRSQADAFDGLGARRDVDAGARFMSFGLACLGEKFAEAAGLVGESVRSPLLSEEALEPSRQLAAQSLSSVLDEPQQRCAYAARARHFPEPFDRSGLGTAEGLSAVTLADARRWSSDAGARGSLIGVAGPLAPGRVREIIEPIVRGWGGGGAEVAAAGEAERGYGHLEDETNQVQVMLVYDAAPETHRDSLLEKVAVSALSGGSSGRLFTEVREKRGLCYAVSAGYRGDRDFGSVTAYVGTTPERAGESLEVLAAELVRLSEGGLTAEEFDRALVGMKSRLVFSGESTGARASAVAGDLFKFGEPRSLEARAEEVGSVTLEEVNAYLKRRDLGRVTVQTLGPSSLAGVAGSLGFD